MTASKGISLHQVPLCRRHCRHLVLANQRVPTNERWWRDRPFPSGLDPVVRVAPQRVVVTVGDGHVAYGVRPWPSVVGRERVGLGYADTGPQPGDAFISDLALFPHGVYLTLRQI